jgi:predicted nucleotide-binding protein
MNAHVFISYGRDDARAYVDRLAEYLAAAGVATWFDQAVTTGDRWLDAIQKSLESAAVVIVVMSPSAEHSPWVTREILWAQNDGTPSAHAAPRTSVLQPGRRSV